MNKIQNIELLNNWKKYTLQEMIDLGIIISHLDGNHGELYPNKEEFVEDGVPYLSANCIINGEVDFTKTKFLTQKRADTFIKGVAKNNDLLFAHNATVGPVAILKTSLDYVILSTTLTYYRCNSEFLLPEYLRLYMISDFFVHQYELVMKQATRNQVPITKQRTFFHLLPPLPEQQRIVAILDEAFDAIARAKANAEQNLKNARELFESYLQGVFENKGEGWEEKTLEQISKTFGRGKSKHRPRNDEKLYGGEYPFIQTGDIRNCDHYITAYTQTYNEAGLAQSKLWPSGSICITIAANIAETGVLTFDACFPDSVIGLVVNEKLADRDFVEYLLQSFKAKLQALGKGSAQANINMGTFENESFPFPSVKEQKSIVQKLDALSTETKKLEAIYKQKIADLEELKKSLLQKAFKGELKSVREAIDVGGRHNTTDINAAVLNE
ncbi:MAG: restriction endonuclease subunit S [Sphingobacteriales bacterium]